MELILTPEEQAFRNEVRAFIEAKLPADISHKVEYGLRLKRDDFIRWQKALFEKGWIAPNWPKKYGGTGWTPMQRHIFDEELGRAWSPMIIPFGLTMVGPVIYTFGNDAQKERFLPRILSSDDWWCQGYSEPGAGSDLASLKTRAVRDGDDYVVNGQKTWTTYAQYADWIFCLVRTDPAAKQQEGISFLLIDMKSPGITVKPIRTFDGGAEVNEVFFDDVRVPAENLIGEENKGWTYAKFLLGHERTSIARVGGSKKALARLKDIARKEVSRGRPLIEDARFRDRIAEVELELLALESVVLNGLASEARGRPPGPEASLLKIKGTVVQQGLTELALEAIGPYAAPYIPEAFEAGWNEAPVGPDYAMALAPTHFNVRKTSIYGGSNEIQKNIIAKMVLGL
jgi:alkylation response protein AidB-like acyl-CoA dehydrogenase